MNYLDASVEEQFQQMQELHPGMTDVEQGYLKERIYIDALSSVLKNALVRIADDTSLMIDAIQALDEKVQTMDAVLIKPAMGQEH